MRTEFAGLIARRGKSLRSSDPMTATNRPGLSPMSGRDPHESHRAATPLELLYDLTLVVAFATASHQAAEYMAEGHWRTALTGFGFAMFAVSWAWIGFSWFASAFDTDDWLHRLLTMVQMVGVLILALGLPTMFASIEHGVHVDNGVMVLGYVVMRFGLIGLWLRAARAGGTNRSGPLSYARSLLVAQVGWIALALTDTSIPVMFGVAGVLIVVEMTGPFLAEKQVGGTPWHPHHIAERYSLLVIITLGEAILGTYTAIDAAVSTSGWSTETALVGLSGVGLALAMWWLYFDIPFGDLLARSRHLSFGWGYGHILVFASLAATGAALQVAAAFIDHHAHIGLGSVVAAVTIPVGCYLILLFAIHTRLADGADRPLVLGLVVPLGLLVGAAALAGAGAAITVCLPVIALAPAAAVAIGSQGRRTPADK